MMQIVEFSDRGVACFEHFHVREGRDRLDVVGRQPREKAVHHLAPRPETVTGRTATFGKPGHAPLERVAMQVGNARHGDMREPHSPLAARIRRDCADDPVLDLKPHGACPAVGEQRMVEKQ